MLIPQKTSNTYILAIIAILLLIAIDYFSKSFIRELLLSNNYTFKLTSFLDLVYSWNYGISFGMFTEYHLQSNYIFIVLNSGIVLYICWLLAKSSSRLMVSGYLLLIGGALGNIIDRIVNGAVFDFIYFNYAQFYFPVFNIADCFISLGALFLLIACHNETKLIAESDAKEYDENAV